MLTYLSRFLFSLSYKVGWVSMGFWQHFCLVKVAVADVVVVVLFSMLLLRYFQNREEESSFSFVTSANALFHCSLLSTRISCNGTEHHHFSTFSI